MEKSKYGIFTFCHTLAYCLISFLSAGAILLGIYHDNDTIFHVGFLLVVFWMVNPLGLVVPLVGLVKNLLANKFKLFFVLCILAACASWFVAGIMVGSVL